MLAHGSNSIKVLNDYCGIIPFLCSLLGRYFLVLGLYLVAFERDHIAGTFPSFLLYVQEVLSHIVIYIVTYYTKWVTTSLTHSIWGYDQKLRSQGPWAEITMGSFTFQESNQQAKVYMYL